MNKAFTPFSPFAKSLAQKMGSPVRAQDSEHTTLDSLPPATGHCKVTALGLLAAPLDHPISNLAFGVGRPKLVYRDPVTPTKSVVGLATAEDTPAGSQRKPKKTRRSFDTMVEDCESVPLTDAQVIAMSPTDLLKLATGGKDEALALQVFAESCTPASADHLVAGISQHVEELASHPTGNFVIQKLIRGYPSFADLVAAHCRADFAQLAANEFSSRVMQCLIETNPAFRKHALTLFRKDLETYTQTFAAAFLVSVAVRCADSDEERDLLSGTLAVSPKRWLARKYFKRVLVAYIAVCSQNALERLFSLLSKTLAPYDFFRDRYSCLVLLACVERGLAAAQYAVFEVLFGRSFDLFRWSVFKYFLEHLIEKPTLDKFRIKLHINLRSLHPNTMKAISTNPRVYYNFNSALGLTLGHCYREANQQHL